MSKLARVSGGEFIRFPPSPILYTQIERFFDTARGKDVGISINPFRLVHASCGRNSRRLLPYHRDFVRLKTHPKKQKAKNGPFSLRGNRQKREKSF
jgi:hypothetical protein